MDKPIPQTPPVIIAPGQGTLIKAFGEEIIMHLGAAQTGGKLSLWTEISPPGGGPPPHYHLYDDECFLVEEGAVSFFIDGAWSQVGPGGVVHAPIGSVHTFKNNTDKPTRMRISTSPGGFEVFFTRCAEEFAKPGGPEMERIVAISAEHGIHYVNP